MLGGYRYLPTSEGSKPQDPNRDFGHMQTPGRGTRLFLNICTACSGWGPVIDPSEGVSLMGCSWEEPSLPDLIFLPRDTRGVSHDKTMSLHPLQKGTASAVHR